MKKHIITATFLLLGLSSCSDYLDVNKNPSTPQSADVNVLLPPMFAQMERGEQFDSRYAGQYIQNWAQRPITPGTATGTYSAPTPVAKNGGRTISASVRTSTSSPPRHRREI